MNPRPTPELLESRIAPAALVTPTIVTYTDADGDLITVKTSKGTFADPNDPAQTMWSFSAAVTGVGERLRFLAIDGLNAFEGANITITAAQREFGDGVVSVDSIYAEGIDLGTVRIAGDLGEIDCGDSDTKPGLAALSVLSLGVDQVFGQTSTIQGPVGSIKVSGNMDFASIDIQGTATTGKLTSLTVGGSINGSFFGEGVIQAAGAIAKAVISGDLGNGRSDAAIIADSIGSLTIGGSILGGGDIAVSVTGALAKLAIGGSIIGGSSEASGSVLVGSIGTATIAGSISAPAFSAPYSGVVAAITGGIKSITVAGSLSGESEVSGLISANGNIGKLVLGGSIHGGGANSSGGIIVAGTLGNATIRGGIQGGSNFSDTDPVSNTGFVLANRITTLTISGSIRAGEFDEGGLFNSGAVRATIDIGTLTVRGSIVGTEGGAFAVVSAGGNAQGTSGADVAIRSLVVGGSVHFAKVLAGYTGDISDSPLGKAVDADASIGSVKVSGDWQASDLIAGIAPGSDSYFGDSNDELISGATVRDTAGVSQIASIIIGGRVLGTPSSFDSGHNGFGAELLGTLKIGGLAQPAFLNAAHTDTFAAGKARPIGTTQQIGGTPDVYAYEL